MTRGAALLVAWAGCAALAAAAAEGPLTWTPFVAALPGALATSGLALVPPPARHLRAIGWTLVAISFATATVLIVG